MLLEKVGCHTLPNEGLLQPFSPFLPFKRCCHTHPNDKLPQPPGLISYKLSCCHTPPNERLLQRRATDCDSVCRCHTYPNDRLPQQKGYQLLFQDLSCHTYPNDRLPQPIYVNSATIWLFVVIPILMTGFHNYQPQMAEPFRKLSYLS